MELLVALTIGGILASGTFLLLRPYGFPVVLGLVLVSHGINLLLVVMGRITVGAMPIVSRDGGPSADPLAQALVLTAIVISFGTTAFLLVLAYRDYQATGNERVDLEDDA